MQMGGSSPSIIGIGFGDVCWVTVEGTRFATSGTIMAYLWNIGQATMDVFLAAGWSPSALLHALSPIASSDNPKKSQNDRPITADENTDPNSAFTKVLKDAGWSPNGLLVALSPVSAGRVASKRLEKWSTPDSITHRNPKKYVDMKDTPIIDLTHDDSPADLNLQPLRCNATLDEINSLATRLASQTIDADEPLSNPYEPKPFQTAKKLFIDELAGASEYKLRKCQYNGVSSASYPVASHSIVTNTAINERPIPPAKKMTAQFNHIENNYPTSDSIIDADFAAPLPNGWTLFDYQRETIQSCLQQRRSILALDMGLGKTIISLVWAKEMCRTVGCSSCIAVVVAPCTLLETWKREASLIGFECIDKEYRALHRGSCPRGIFQPPLLLLVSWAKIPTPAEVIKYGCRLGETCNYVLICDEAHAMQSLRSQRTRDALALCSHRSCIGTVLATGTPMKNGRPSNIFPLLLGIRHPLGQNRIAFETRYCDAKKTKFCQWDTTGASNLQELQERIGPVLIRKTKEECLSLPPLIRCRVKVDIASDSLREYDDIVRGYKTKRVILQRQGRTDSTSLEMMSALRHLTSLAKVAPTVRAIESLLRDEPNSPVVVFVWFRETLRELLGALSSTRFSIVSPGQSEANGSAVREGRFIRCGAISGDMGKQLVRWPLHKLWDRQRVIDSFQAGELDVIICTYGVGCVGLTLTRSHTVVLLDRPWTPGDARQAEDRVRRIGQTASAIKSVWIAGFTLDDCLDELIQKKDKNSEIVVSDYDVTISGDLSQSASEWFTTKATKLNRLVDGDKQSSKIITQYFTASNASIRVNLATGLQRNQQRPQQQSIASGDEEVKYIWTSTDREEVPEKNDRSCGKEDTSTMKSVLLKILL